MHRIVTRLLASLPVLAGAVVLAFLVTRALPGDPLAARVATGMTPAEIEALRRDLGLDLPLARDFMRYLAALARGDLGSSAATGRSVAGEIALRLPASAELTLAAFGLALLLALPPGLLAALRPGGLADRLCRGGAALALSVPTFVTGLFLIHVFYFRLGWAPEPSGRLDPFLAEPPRVTGFLTVDAALAGDGAALASAAGHLALPALSMALFALGPLARITRASLARALASPWAAAARARGLAPSRVVLAYALPNALVPVITAMAMTLSVMLGANVLVEKVFAWPGLGRFAIDSLMLLDAAPLQGFVLVMAAVFLAANLAADIACALIDPRDDA